MTLKITKQFPSFWKTCEIVSRTHLSVTFPAFWAIGYTRSPCQNFAIGFYDGFYCIYSKYLHGFKTIYWIIIQVKINIKINFKYKKKQDLFRVSFFSVCDNDVFLSPQTCFELCMVHDLGTCQVFFDQIQELAHTHKTFI